MKAFALPSLETPWWLSATLLLRSFWVVNELCRMGKHTAEQIRKTMQAVKSKGSKIEILLTKALWAKGHRYRKNDKTVFGKPDITFRKIRLAIFVDSEFWHGKDWDTNKLDHKSNKSYWFKKIERNMDRDKTVTLELTKHGWKVLRFWGNQIEKNLDYCVSEIEQEIKARKALQDDRFIRRNRRN